LLADPVAILALRFTYCHQKVSKSAKKCHAETAHNGGNDRFSARLGILTILTIGFFVYGNQNYDSIGPEKCFFRIYHHAT
jgi:hypothetical protein